MEEDQVASLSKEEVEKITQFDWNEEEIQDFIWEFLIFSPKERMEILDDMLEKSQAKESKRHSKI